MACAVEHKLESRFVAQKMASAGSGETELVFNNLGSNGTVINGLHLNNITSNGLFLNGLFLNGLFLNGLFLNGLFLNGLFLNGLFLNGLFLNGVHFNGLFLNGLDLGQLEYDGLPLDSEQADTFKTALGYMTHCALESDQCITTYDLDGSPLRYCGEEGLDPGWATDPPDLTRSQAVGACVYDLAVAAGDEVEQRPVYLDAFKTVLRYLVECALERDESVVIFDENDEPITYYGALGLAPEWKDETPSPRGQRLVSACLAARSNANGQPVHISLRNELIPTTVNENELFDHHEGAFYADLFAQDAYINSCYVAGGGLSGRICAETDACGFSVQGACESVCSTQNRTDGSYNNCNGDDTVINVFLNVGQQVGFGSEHSCYKKSDGTLHCWGANRAGQLGIGVFSRQEEVPIEVADLGDGVLEVASGFSHTCARKRNGTLYCWGQNSHGQLGDGSTRESALPIEVESLDGDVATIGMGKRHSCAHKTDGTLWCWGRNLHGQLGNGTQQNSLEPSQVEALGTNVAEVSIGTNSNFTCAVDNNGYAWCWGKNSRGQLGDGTHRNRTEPRLVEIERGSPLDQVTEMCVGKAHTCARRSDKSVWCWGDDSRGQLGDGPGRWPQPRPTQVDLDGDAALHGLSCGSQHTCTVMTDGTLRCWGRNLNGELGDGTYRPRLSPVPVRGLGSTVRSITLADKHSCAMGDAGKLWCWGKDPRDFLFPGRSSNVPVPIDFFE